MEFLITLWLPIVVGAAVSFVGSMIVWMVLPHHRSDYAGLPEEDASIEVLKRQNLAPGFYNFPHCASWDDLKKPEVLAKFKEGPIGYLTIAPSGLPPMGKNMLQQFLYFLVTGVLIAYVANLSLSAGAAYLKVFQVTGVVAWLAYSFAIIPDAIWYSRPKSIVIKHMLDGLLYALMTAGVYGWLWPAAA